MYMKTQTPRETNQKYPIYSENNLSTDFGIILSTLFNIGCFRKTITTNNADNNNDKHNNNIKVHLKMKLKL